MANGEYDNPYAPYGRPPYREPRPRGRAMSPARGPPYGGPPRDDPDRYFGKVPYHDVPGDVRRAYEVRRGIGREPPPPTMDEVRRANERRRAQMRDPSPPPMAPPPPRHYKDSKDNRRYNLYPQGYSIQPGKFQGMSPPPSYRASSGHPRMMYGMEDEMPPPMDAFSMPAEMPPPDGPPPNHHYRENKLAPYM